jgi:hypothetical protein
VVDTGLRDVGRTDEKDITSVPRLEVNHRSRQFNFAIADNEMSRSLVLLILAFTSILLGSGLKFSQILRQGPFGLFRRLHPS